MPISLLDLPTDTLSVRPWIDPVIDRVGHDPRSTYVERFWLGILGPSTSEVARLRPQPVSAWCQRISRLRGANFTAAEVAPLRRRFPGLTDRATAGA